MKKEQVISRLKKLIDNNSLFSNIILNCKDEQTSWDVIYQIIYYAFNKNVKDLDFNKLKDQIQNNTHVDILTIGNNINITNQEVLDLINKMSLSATATQNIKFFIIKNAQNLKQSAANSLLKFLEEPPINTYGILLTNNYSEIINTIWSRCQLINIDNETKIDNKLNRFEELLISKNKDGILLFNKEMKAMNKNELIKMIDDAYNRTIIYQFTNLISCTLELLDDLKFLPLTNIAIDNYLIRIVEQI
ncbi:DNA polymerase III subunit delta [Mycoplasma mycoides]|uniref:DNA polymerase III subunit delta n=1 Tax=Mycoplasma mycoides TaxID=2102 RepID=UPI0027339A5C|nr:DNA polymerase III subunit delta [Mycoplasma mycoides]MDP4040673.1 DNA polymerase III subunit delta [Mycoplasma mycoides]MDP4041496.1 DNA polymerase III subunit delta [Mycoplasma mycoides]MDP4042434.1 DNA polymerase III subunit delta [Mycoplasma mycoides]MDP4043856.1 DNA polymerase III subunit delta [Mycoplasma mycoides]MDP4044781.1 DNA polymerase III subunit delta [Mycoplasma mycoides]